MQLTYRYRIKDKHAKRLNAQARAVNFVWNYCNETQQRAARVDAGVILPRSAV
jgi:putative transposase